MSYHGGSTEYMEGLENNARNRRMEAGSRAYSTSAIHLTATAPTQNTQHPARPKGYNSDDNLFEPFQEPEFSHAEPHGKYICLFLLRGIMFFPKIPTPARTLR
ncbi:hypothetical protein FKM82_017100 [Ascaphus truei]